MPRLLEAHRYRLTAKVGVSVSAENGVLGLTLANTRMDVSANPNRRVHEHVHKRKQRRLWTRLHALADVTHTDVFVDQRTHSWTPLHPHISAAHTITSPGEWWEESGEQLGGINQTKSTTCINPLMIH